MPVNCKVHRQSPLVLFICGYGSLKTADIETFKTFFDKHLNGKSPFKVFVDLRKLNSPSQKILKPLTEFMMSVDERAPGKIVASSVIVDSIIIEQALSALFAVRPPSTPTKVTSCIDKACSFLDRIVVEN